MELSEIKVGPTYTPYQLDNYQHCPQHWQLAKRWKLRDSKQYTAMIIGSAVALGLEKYYQQSSDDPYEAAERYAVQAWNANLDRSRKRTVELVHLGVQMGMATDLSIKEVVAVEKPFNRNRPDLVARYYDGSLVVIDHKVKMNLEDKWFESTMQEWDTSNQFFTYAYEVGKAYSEPVNQVFAHVIILDAEPKDGAMANPRTYVHPVRIDPGHLAYWLAGAAQDWRSMAAIQGQSEAARPRFTACKTKYGLCEMYQLCHTLHGDESQADVFYDAS